MQIKNNHGNISIFSEIIGETPVHLLNSTLLAVLPTWGPIYEFSFEFRLNCELVPLCEITDINKGLSWGEHQYDTINQEGHANVFNLLKGILSFSTQDPPLAFQKCTESNCIPRIETNNPLGFGFRMREGEAKRTFKLNINKSFNKRPWDSC